MRRSDCSRSFTLRLTWFIALLCSWACEEKSDPTVAPVANDPQPASSSSFPSTSSVATASEPKAATSPPANSFTVTRDGQQRPPIEAKRVLHVGDSMVPLVANYIRPVVEKRGDEYRILSTSSSSTESWAEGEELAAALKEYQPDLVLISLGSNELYVEDLELRARAINKIVSQVAPRACLWIAPPAWTKGKGFLETLEKAVAPCRYFDSTKLDFDRQEDGKHPTWASSYRWAARVYEALGGKEPLSRQ